MPFITGFNRNQAQMFPEYLEDYIDQENPVRVIDAFVDTLDIKKNGFTKSDICRTGAPSYNPKDILKLYLYGYINGIRTSRKLEKATYNNIEIIWLMRKLHPDFKTIADFRKENKKQLTRVLKDFNMLCKEWELFGGEMVAVDGTKFRADNSKRNNYNKKKIDRQISYIEEKVAKYLKDLEDGDKEPEENVKYTADELKAKITELEKRKTFYKGLEEELKTRNENEISTTDPDARLMDNKKNGLEVNYNVQIAVDAKNSLIVALDVTNRPSDQGHLDDMVQASKETLGIDEKASIEVVADKGYYQAEDLKKCADNNTTTYVTHQTYSNATGNPEYYAEKFKYDPAEDVYVCPEGHKLHKAEPKKEDVERIKYRNYEACSGCPNKDKCTKAEKGRVISRSRNQDFLDIVDARTNKNMDKYLKRQMIVEHPFGTVKRTMNAGYFLTRGLASVLSEASLTFLAYNIKRVINILGVKELVRRLKAKHDEIGTQIHNSRIFLILIIKKKYATVY